MALYADTIQNFYPRPPRGGRQSSTASRMAWTGFLSTPSARRATIDAGVDVDALRISIHALREEGDILFRVVLQRHNQFLSTPSARRATTSNTTKRKAKKDFYPRPPRGGRPIRRRSSSFPLKISIHALREEGDPIIAAGITASAYFYPRPPRGGRQYRHISRRLPYQISIHALREEGDRLRQKSVIRTVGFLSTPSARRATSC